MRNRSVSPNVREHQPSVPCTWWKSWTNVPNCLSPLSGLYSQGNKGLTTTEGLAQDLRTRLRIIVVSSGAHTVIAVEAELGRIPSGSAADRHTALEFDRSNPCQEASRSSYKDEWNPTSVLVTDAR